MLRFSYTPEVPMNDIVGALKKAASTLLGRPLEFEGVEFEKLPDQNGGDTCFHRVLAAEDVKITSRVENGPPPGYKQSHTLEVLGGTLRGYGQYYDTTLWEVSFEAKGLEAHYSAIRAALTEVIGAAKDQCAKPYYAMSSAKVLIAAGEKDAAMALVADCQARIAAGDTDTYEAKFNEYAAQFGAKSEADAGPLPKLTGRVIRGLVGEDDLPRLKRYFEDAEAERFAGSLLQAASFQGKPEILHWILERSTFESLDLQAALGNASNGGHAEMIPALVTAGAQLDLPSAFGDLPLATASFHNNLPLARALLKAGADADVISKFPTNLKSSVSTADGQSPVLNAMREGHADMVRLLLENGADANLKLKSGRTLLEVARELAPAMVSLLQEFGAAELDAAELTLREAAKRGLAERVRELLSSSSVEDRDHAMGEARQSGHYEVAREISDAGLSQWGYDSGMYGAVSAGRVDDARYCVSKGADPMKTMHGEFLIHWAARGGRTDMVRFLVTLGLSVDQRGGDGHTPLHYAVDRSHHDTIRALLDLGANASAVAGDGATPLSNAQDDVSRALLSAAGSSDTDGATRAKDIKAKLKSCARSTYGFEPGSEGGPAASRFGGLPGLLEGEAWPKGRSGHLRFFAQLDFANLPKSAHKRFGTRVLQVFLAPDVSPHQPDVLLRWVNADALCASEAPADVEVFAETLIHDFKRATKDYPLREDGLAEHDALQPHEQQLLQGINKAGDKTGGWPHWIQEADYSKCSKCDEPMSLLVLQIDSNHALDYTFGDNGVGYVLACPAHLDELRFTFQSA